MDNVLIISVVVLFLLIVVSHMMNKKASEKVHTSITKDLTIAKTELTTALASTKTELTTALAPVKDSVLKIEGDLNTIKPGTVLPGGTILTALLQNALQTRNFVFLEEELNKIFKSSQDANNILFLGNVVISKIKGGTCKGDDKECMRRANEQVSFTVPVFVTKRDGKYIYFVNQPYDL